MRLRPMVPGEGVACDQPWNTGHGTRFMRGGEELCLHTVGLGDSRTFGPCPHALTWGTARFSVRTFKKNGTTVTSLLRCYIVSIMLFLQPTNITVL